MAMSKLGNPSKKPSPSTSSFFSLFASRGSSLGTRFWVSGQRQEEHRETLRRQGHRRARAIVHGHEGWTITEALALVLHLGAVAAAVGAGGAVHRGGGSTVTTVTAVKEKKRTWWRTCSNYGDLPLATGSSFGGSSLCSFEPRGLLCVMSPAVSLFYYASNRIHDSDIL